MEKAAVPNLAVCQGRCHVRPSKIVGFDRTPIFCSSLLSPFLVNLRPKYSQLHSISNYSKTLAIIISQSKHHFQMPSTTPKEINANVSSQPHATELVWGACGPPKTRTRLEHIEISSKQAPEKQQLTSRERKSSKF